MRQSSAQIFQFPAPPRVTVARPGAPFTVLAGEYERQLHDARQAMRYAILGAIACAAVAMMCAICAYAFYVSAILAQSVVLWGFATAMIIVGVLFLSLGYREYQDYGGILQLYRGTIRCGRLQA